MNTYSFLDVETTGLSPRRNDRICEIAVLKYRRGKKIAHWHSLVNPGRHISYGASMVNGITDDMVASAPYFDEVAQKVLRFIEGTTLVCHNAPFDLGFLSSELDYCGLCLPEMPVIDTLMIARRHFSFPSNSLTNIAACLGIKIKGKHRALADVYTTYEIFKYFNSKIDLAALVINDN